MGGGADCEWNTQGAPSECRVLAVIIVSSTRVYHSIPQVFPEHLGAVTGLFCSLRYFGTQRCLTSITCSISDESTTVHSKNKTMK